MSHKPKVVIIGAGFAGLNAAKGLKNIAVDVLMIDQNNYHTFQPLLYQVATAGLEPADIAHQVRHIFKKQKNFRFRQGTVVTVNWDKKYIVLKNNANISFDYLIIAAGAVYNDFGVRGVKEHAIYLKSLADAANLRSHILQQFELASAKPELINSGILNFVIVGAGPTGVEMAGALMELFSHALKNDYPELDLSRAKVIMLEASPNVLNSYSSKSQTYTERILRKRGVDLRLNTTVKKVNKASVELHSGETIATKSLIWAAGVRAHPLVEALGLELTHGFRIKVTKALNIADKPFIYALGDIAGMQNKDGGLHPQVATVAIQQGKHAAKQIKKQIKGKTIADFDYFNKGNMAIIGRNAGVAELSKNLSGMHLRGFLGWTAWLFIHLIYLPGHQNRFIALANWTYNYFSYDRHVRLISFMQNPARTTKAGKDLSSKASIS